ncbi:MAG: GMC oxidoreductase [Cyclonatronaceae bacterium]
MKIQDANQLSSRTMHSDICIIGAGPAGLTLAGAMAPTGRDILIADSGGRRFEKEPDELNAMQTDSNFLYRNGRSNRARQTGGSAALWAGRVVPFDFHPVLDREWGELPAAIVPHFDEAFRLLNIEPDIRNDHEHQPGELYGYWANRTQRFRTTVSGTRNGNCSLFNHLTCIGEAEFDGDRLKSLVFLNQKLERIRISAGRFIFAMGGIENSRMLLLMREQIEKRLGEHFGNVGKYVMDHPRISHGTIVPQGSTSEITRYLIKVTPRGMYKTGIRNHPVHTRAYCNIMVIPGKLTRRVMRLPARSFQVSSKKLLLKEAGLLRTLASQGRLLPVLSGTDPVSSRIMRFVNNRSYSTYKMMAYCEQRPRAHNRIIIGTDTDRNAQPVARLCNHLHPEELYDIESLYRRMEKHAGILNCTFSWDPEFVNNPANYTDASHIIGGTRYSGDASRAVVDHRLSVFGIPNLYITGSSVFPTSGVENPTHLIIALSLRLAGILKEDVAKYC